MYGKLDDKMYHDDGVILSDRAWKRAEEERASFGQASGSAQADCQPAYEVSEETMIAVRLECLKIAANRFDLGVDIQVAAGEFAAFVLGKDDSADIAADNDFLMQRMEAIAKECRDAGV